MAKKKSGGDESAKKRGPGRPPGSKSSKKARVEAPAAAQEEPAVELSENLVELIGQLAGELNAKILGDKEVVQVLRAHDKPEWMPGRGTKWIMSVVKGEVCFFTFALYEVESLNEVNEYIEQHAPHPWWETAKGYYQICFAVEAYRFDGRVVRVLEPAEIGGLHKLASFPVFNREGWVVPCDDERSLEAFLVSGKFITIMRNAFKASIRKHLR